MIIEGTLEYPFCFLTLLGLCSSLEDYLGCFFLAVTVHLRANPSYVRISLTTSVVLAAFFFVLRLTDRLVGCRFELISLSNLIWKIYASLCLEITSQWHQMCSVPLAPSFGVSS